jgi:hypothetical protein
VLHLTVQAFRHLSFAPNVMAGASPKVSVSYFPGLRLPDLTITQNFGLIPYARAVSYFPAPRLNCLGVSAPIVCPGLKVLDLLLTSVPFAGLRRCITGSSNRPTLRPA